MIDSFNDQLTYVMTLANSIIGVGVLAMPFCFQKCGIILSIVVLLVSGGISRLSCHFLLKSSLLARRKNFEFLAFHTLGPTGKIAVELGVIGFLMGTVIAFFVVVGDLGPQIIAKALNLTPTNTLRSWVMVVVSVGCVLPLGLLKNVDSLATVCTATIGFYVCLVIKVMSESTEHIVASDWQDKVELWRPSGLLQCVPIFSMALFCQTQIFEIYDTMPNPTLEKMNQIVRWAVTICTVVYILVGSFGYIAFCNVAFSGNILMSFAPSMTSDIIKMGFVLSVAFSFPLVIFPCRSSLYSLLFRRVSHQHDIVSLIPERRFRCITVFIVGTGLLIGLLLPCIEVVLGLVGSTMGVAVCILLPAMCYVKISKPNTERLLAQCMIVAGILIMVLGTYANLYAMDEVTSDAIVVDRVPGLTNVKIEDEVKKFADKIKSADIEDKADFPGELLNSKEKLLKEILKADVLKVDDVSIKEIVQDNARIEPPMPVDIEHEDKNKSDQTQDNVEIKPLADIKSNDYQKNDKPSNNEYKVQTELPKLIKLTLQNEEISSDAIKKEEQELALANDNVKKNDPNNEKIILTSENQPKPKTYIQDIEKERKALQREFREGVIDMNLANLNESKIQTVLPAAQIKSIETVETKISTNNKAKVSEIKIDDIDKNKLGIIPAREINLNQIITDEKRSNFNIINAQKAPKNIPVNNNDNINPSIDEHKPGSLLKSKLGIPIALTMSNNTADYTKHVPLDKQPDMKNVVKQSEDAKSHQRDILEVKTLPSHDRNKRETNIDVDVIPENCDKSDVTNNIKTLNNNIILINRLSNPSDLHSNTIEKEISLKQDTDSFKPLARDLKSIKIFNKNRKK